MKIFISMEVDDDYADPNDSTGVTEEGFNEILDALMHLGDDIKIRARASAE